MNEIDIRLGVGKISSVGRVYHSEIEEGNRVFELGTEMEYQDKVLSERTGIKEYYSDCRNGTEAYEKGIVVIIVHETLHILLYEIGKGGYSHSLDCIDKNYEISRVIDEGK